MMTSDSIYKNAETPKPPVNAPIDPNLPWSFVLYEAGLGSRILGVGRDQDEMYKVAAQNEGLTEEALRKGGHKFAVEQIPEMPSTFVPLGSSVVDEEGKIKHGLGNTQQLPDTVPTLTERRREWMAKARAARGKKKGPV